MAVAAYKTYASGETLTASDLNASFAQIHDNGEDLGWPATKAKDLDGQKLILDGDADTSIHASTDDQIDVEVLGFDALRVIGVASAVNGLDIKPSATTNAVLLISRGSDTDIDIDIQPAGAGMLLYNGTEVSTGSTPLTTRGDLLTRDASSNIRLAIGSANTVLTSDGTDASWGNLTGEMIAFGSDTRGDVIRRGTSNWERLAIGSSGQFLTSDGTDVSWGALTSSSDTVAGTIERAVQSEMEAASSTSLAVTPGRMHYHPGVPKAWGRATGTGSALSEDYGVASITDSGTGDIRFTWDTAFTTSTYCVVGSIHSTQIDRTVTISAVSTTSADLACFDDSSNVQADPGSGWHIVAFGDHA